jgi:hypothetical protein
MASSYYPPRARWYSPVLRPWFRLQRALHLEKIRLPVGFTVGQVILSLLLPGFALFVNGRKKVGMAFVGIYIASLVCFVVWLGFSISAVGYGLMISIHASSIVFLQSCTLRDKYEFGVRFLLAVGTLFLVWLAVYRPVAKFAEGNWWTPMLIQGKVVVMRPMKPGGPVLRSDRLLYSIGGEQAGNVHSEGGVGIRTGFGWGPVLAVAGDTIRFSTNAYFVNGNPQPRLPHMPVTGEILLPEKHWFIWPQLDISGRGNVGEEIISSTMLPLAVVSEKQFIGKPFACWFGRRQISP